MSLKTTVVGALLAGGLGLACDEGPTSPSGTAIVTFQVGPEQFRVRLTTEAQVRAARAAQAGGPASIPVGRIVSGTEVNAGWSWHLENVTFAEVTIELCDGRPSDVERAGPGFANGQFCPWSARITEIQP
jgi:hypothetical protein